MNKPRINPERATAMHEAGHAVIAVYFELGIDSVTIKSETGRGGCSCLTGLVVQRTGQLFRAFLVSGALELTGSPDVCVPGRRRGTREMARARTPLTPIEELNPQFP